MWQHVSDLIKRAAENSLGYEHKMTGLTENAKKWQIERTKQTRENNKEK